MRLNQYLAAHTELSRRKADDAIAEGRVEINGTAARLGDTVIESDRVTLDSHAITPVNKTLIIMHKPIGFVVSKNGQGSKTVYDLLPPKYQHLKPVGRLDKDSSGLLLLTNDGELANKLAHPSFAKDKRYTIQLDKRLHTADLEKITKEGVDIGDARPSRFNVIKVSDMVLHAHLQEGRNRQIRRTFEKLGYKVTKLHRTHFGQFSLGHIKSGSIELL